MDRKANLNIPFDFYDFFGYIFPGIAFIIYLTIFCSYGFPSISLSGLFEMFTIKQQPVISGIVVAIIGIVSIYVVGHTIATISSISADRVLVNGIAGYPVIYLLELNQEKREYSEATYKYLFTLANLLLLVPLLFRESLKILTFVLLSFIALLIIFRVLIKLAKISGDRKRIAEFGSNKVIRFIYLKPASLVLDPLIKLLDALLGLDRKFPQAFIQRYKKLFLKKFGLNPEKVESENYWLAFFSSVERNPYFAGIFRTWLHLYGFARNISCASYLSAALVVIYVLFAQNPDVEKARIQLLVSLFLAWVFLIRYWILYRTYYTKSIIRAFFASSNSDQAQTHSKGKQIQVQGFGKTANEE